ncbi:MAG: glycosyltransferase family 4 protein [Alphaproteobacteria bacterium]|nr:glycosyltransferase family 4 protein [Alphaproteobacteria bacterium]
MRVLAAIVVPPHLSVSGGARAGERLSAAMTRYCDVTVASMMNEASAQGVQPGDRPVRRVPVRSWLPSGVPWNRLPNRYATLFYRSDLPEIAIRGKYDLVHLHNPMPGLELARVARACSRHGIPYVISTHGFNEVARGNEIYGFGALRRLAWSHLVKRPVARAVRHADGIFALSGADFAIVRGMGYVGPAPTVVCNGVDAPAAVPAVASAGVLERLGIPAARSKGQITCLFLANHTPHKGLPVLLKAFGRLKRPYLLIVGGEKRRDIDYERHVRTCGEGQRIAVTGRLADDEVSALFRRSDLFVFPTLADTFPLVVLEAMAHGLPVVASRIGGIPYQLTEECGALVDAGDDVQLASMVDRLADAPDRLVAMGRAARGRVAAEFTWDAAAARAFDGYTRASSRRPAAQAAAVLGAQAV